LTKILFASSVTAAMHNLGIDVATARGLEDAAKVLWETWRGLLSRPDGDGIFYGDRLRTMKINRRVRVISVGQRPPHIASKEGDPPTRDSGELVGSIRIWEVKKGEHYRVGSTHWKAAWLEYGVGPGYAFQHPAWVRERRADPDRLGGNRLRRSPTASSQGGPALRKLVIAPRPHARPALALAQPKMNANFVAALRTAKPITFDSIDLLAVRRGLLGFSAVVGNLSALGIRFGFLSKLRGASLGLERGLGDTSALLTGNLGLRAARRIAGQRAGRFIGDVTRGMPAGFARRVSNRFVSQTVTSPALRKMFR